jgi:hypothetical protein
MHTQQYIQNKERILTAGVVISDKADFKIRRDKVYFICIKGAIQQEELIIINLYAPNISAPKNTTGHKITDRPQDNNSGCL